MTRHYVAIILSLFLHQQIFSQSRDLNFYLSTAEQNSPLLKDYENQLQKNRIDSLLILAGRKISVSADGLVMIAPVTESGYGYDEAITNEGQLTGVVVLRKSVFQQNSIRAQIAQSNLIADSFRTSGIISRRELEKSIVDQYLQSYSILSEVNFQQKNVDALQDELQLLEPLVKAGIALHTDYFNLQIQIQSENITLMLLRDEYRSNLYVMNALSGIYDTTVLRIAKPDLVWKTSGTYPFDPNIRRFSLDSLSIEAAKNILKYNYIPKVDLFGDAGYNAIPSEISAKKFGFSAGVFVSWNLYDGNQRNLHMQQLTLRQSTNRYYRSFYTTKLQMQLTDLDKKYASTTTIITQLQNEEEQMEKLRELRKQQLEAGQLSVIDYLVSLRDYRDLQKKLIDATLKQQQIISEHNFLVW